MLHPIERLSLPSVLAAAGFLLASPRALAEEQPPTGLLKQDAASSGSTDATAEGFQSAERLDASSTDATELSVAAGGLFAAGNTRASSITSGARFKYRTGPNQLKAAAAFNFSQSSTGAGEPMETTVDNSQGSVRYDRFLTKALAPFLSVSARRDRFQKLDLRLNIDPGLAYYFIDVEKHQLWAELGYDFQFEDRSDDALAEGVLLGTPVEETQTLHNARAFVGYDNKLNPYVTFNTGLEFLMAVTDTDAWRLNYAAGLTSNVAGRLNVALTFDLMYNNQPLPATESTDAQTAVSLVYNLL